MVETSERDELRVDRERLEQLLGAGGESPALDFKRNLDLDSLRGQLELTRHIAAMSAEGGDFVIGADEQGNPTGTLGEREIELLDEARLSKRVRKYLPTGTRLRTAVHEIDGKRLVLLAVAAHPDGICIIENEGSCDGRILFKPGDVFIRRGTSTVPWSNEEALSCIRRVRGRQREDVRAEVREEWEAAMRATGMAQSAPVAPSGATHWGLDLDSFVNAVIEQLRRQDEIPLRRLLAGLSRELAGYSRGNRGIERTADTLDRAAALLGQSVVLDRDDIFDAVLRRLVAGYESALANPHPASSVPAPVLGLMLLERAYAVGALAVRERRFDLVRDVAATKLREWTTTQPAFWLTEIQRYARKYDFMRTVDRNRPPHTWVISGALGCVERNEWLAPDVLQDDDRVVTSLCEFDLLASLAVTSAYGVVTPRLMAANFAGWYERRTDPMVLELLDSESAVRRVVFPDADEKLAQALRVLADQATAGWGSVVPPWDGYEDQRILDFLAAHD